MNQMSDRDQDTRDKVVETATLVREIHAATKDIVKQMLTHDTRLTREESATAEIHKDLSSIKVALNNHIVEDDKNVKQLKKWLTIGFAILIVLLVANFGASTVMGWIFKLGL